MAGGAERTQMLFGAGRIVVASGGEACCRYALIHPRPAIAPVMNMKPVLSGRQPGELRFDHQAPLSAKVTVPKGPPIPAVLIELTVAAAVAAAAVHAPTKRKLATKKLRITMSLKRNWMLESALHVSSTVIRSLTWFAKFFSTKPRVKRPCPGTDAD